MNEQKTDMDFKEMLTGLFNTDFLTPEELETICKAAEMYAAAKIKNLDKAITEEQIEKAAREYIAKYSEHIEEIGNHIISKALKNLQGSAFIAGAKYILQRVDSEAVDFKNWCDKNATNMDFRFEQTHTTEEYYHEYYQEYKNGLK